MFPSEPVPFTVLALLTDGVGEVMLEVVIERLDNLEEIYRYQHAYRFAHPLHEIRFQLRVVRCSFPVAGVYQVSLLADGEVLAQRRLTIVREEE
jgi:hypothetical protein